MKTVLAMSALALAVAAGTAQAHEAGNWIVRAGATMVEPREDNEALQLNGSTLLLGGKTAALGVDGSTQLGLTIEYLFNESWGVELLAATPFKHSVVGTGALAGLKIADADQLPPTLSLIYHFADIGYWKPYAGIGINHTFFFNENITDAAATTLGTLGLTGGRLTLENSTGASIQGGVDYHLDSKWLLNASVRWIDLGSTAIIRFANGSILKSGVDIDPLVYSVAVGYSF